jgi:hypothetical protein
MRAGFSAASIFKVLRAWDIEVEEIEEPEVDES